jgi:hypothetical protein
MAAALGVLNLAMTSGGGVAGVAGVNIISELVDLYTTLNVFHCYTLLHSHSGNPWPWPARSGCAHGAADTHLLGLTGWPDLLVPKSNAQLDATPPTSTVDPGVRDVECLL